MIVERLHLSRSRSQCPPAPGIQLVPANPSPGRGALYSYRESESVFRAWILPGSGLVDQDPRARRWSKSSPTRAARALLYPLPVDAGPGDPGPDSTAGVLTASVATWRDYHLRGGVAGFPAGLALGGWMAGQMNAVYGSTSPTPDLNARPRLGLAARPRPGRAPIAGALRSDR